MPTARLRHYAAVKSLTQQLQYARLDLLEHRHLAAGDNQLLHEIFLIEFLIHPTHSVHGAWGANWNDLPVDLSWGYTLDHYNRQRRFGVYRCLDCCQTW